MRNHRTLEQTILYLLQLYSVQNTVYRWIAELLKLYHYTVQHTVYRWNSGIFLDIDDTPSSRHVSMLYRPNVYGVSEYGNRSSLYT